MKFCDMSCVSACMCAVDHCLNGADAEKFSSDEKYRAVMSQAVNSI